MSQFHAGPDGVATHRTDRAYTAMSLQPTKGTEPPTLVAHRPELELITSGVPPFHCHSNGSDVVEGNPPTP